MQCPTPDTPRVDGGSSPSQRTDGYRSSRRPSFGSEDSSRSELEDTNTGRLSPISRGRSGYRVARADFVRRLTASSPDRQRPTRTSSRRIPELRVPNSNLGRSPLTATPSPTGSVYGNLQSQVKYLRYQPTLEFALMPTYGKLF